MNKSVYIAKSRQPYYQTLNSILLHVPNHALKDVYMLNYGTIKSINSSYQHLFFSWPSVAYKKACNSIEVLIGFINSRSSHRRCPIKIGVLKKFEKFKVAEHLRTTASVIPSFQYTLFISLSIFYFSLEYLWPHGLSV